MPLPIHHLRTLIDTPDPDDPIHLVWKPRTEADFRYIETRQANPHRNEKNRAANAATRWNARHAGRRLNPPFIWVGPLALPFMDVAYALRHGHFPPKTHKAVQDPADPEAVVLIPVGSARMRRGGRNPVTRHRAACDCTACARAPIGESR